MLSTLFLSRIQFAFTMSMHIIFPAFSIGLISFLVFMEGAWLKTKNPVYYQIIRFWTKVFALTFGMGVVSGIAMEFQLGTNWAGFSRQIGSVLGPLFIYEVLSAFFVEAGFIGILIFGWNKVGEKLHYAATIMVAVGTLLSAYWILSANSWMQHPVGYAIENGKYVATNWWEIIFNLYTLPRYLHMVMAAWLATGFAIISISAYYLLRDKNIEFAKKCLRFSVIAIMVLIPLQIIIGDVAGVNVSKSQPLKTAAMEGLWETTKGAPTIIFAIPSNTQQKNLFEFGSIPHGSAILNTHEYNGELVGLKSAVPEDQPEVWPVFFGFRIMTGIGVVMLVYAILATTLLVKNKLYSSRKILYISQFMAPLGFIALFAGWITAEIGRQPWAVYGLIRTKDAVSNISNHDVLISLILIIVIYGIIFGGFYFYFLDKTIKKGPTDLDPVQPFGFLTEGASSNMRGEK
ncbi:MAG: cytochrome ubiquinol oxidase subunit [Burkholderiales bacterium]|jgi:cytochrome d ubiquinol oxidase subunit I|nr:cytochrome ubiquinol oxidase subunit [Burkholderiales bacterium]